VPRGSPPDQNSPEVNPISARANLGSLELEPCRKLGKISENVE